MSEWQPIKTAPKDATNILLSDGHYIQAAAWWSHDDDEDESEGDWIVYCSLIEEPKLHFDPTHWMPLPEPPKETDA